MSTTVTTSSSASYSDCVAALRTSLSFLESSVSTLGSGVADFPRLVSVLKSVRHYELIPQPTLALAEASLRDEIAPAIATLLDRADAHAARAERRVDALKARSELQQGRLHDTTASTATSPPKSKTAKQRLGDGGGGGGGKANPLAGEARLRARATRQRREALRYGVERLELEVLQKERELKKRLDATTATGGGVR
ncbi:DASH complex subunit Spc19 [Hypoxylon rubiginosum]|uniref:DASH complex subunit Spc19 n=1 Tax=Hypoxylon rubiginosum TaxID=110542 RepID=A0ACB9YYT3_9PEZI|nr:DASH complex subunit Spc19 [Hypoxylon rubiginosum]